jgi:hypothetical protein
VLVTPISFRQIDWATRRFHLALTRDKVKHSPSVDTDKPVSRQHERSFFDYYGYPYYWGNPGLWGANGSPGLLAAERLYEVLPDPEALSGDIHLRSAREICGYHIRTTDASAGHIEDFIIDDETWEIRYLVIDTASWWKGSKVLIAPRWTRSISWAQGIVLLDLSKKPSRRAPNGIPPRLSTEITKHVCTTIMVTRSTGTRTNDPANRRQRLATERQIMSKKVNSGQYQSAKVEGFEDPQAVCIEIYAEGLAGGEAVIQFAK